MRGQAVNLYLDKEVATALAEKADAEERNKSNLANRLLRQALGIHRQPSAPVSPAEADPTEAA